MPQGFRRGGSAGSGRRSSLTRSPAARHRRATHRHRVNVAGRTAGFVYRGETEGVSWFRDAAGTAMTFWVDLAWGGGPYDAAFTWESIADDVQAITSRIGRTDEFADYSAGQVMVVLNNSRVDANGATPYNAYDQFKAGSRSGKAVLPGSPLRIRVDPGNGTKYALGWGSVQGFPAEEDLTTSVQTVTLVALDGMSTLDRTQLPESAMASMVLNVAPTIALNRNSEIPTNYYTGQQTADTPGSIEDLVGTVDLSVPTEATTGVGVWPVGAAATIIPPSKPHPPVAGLLASGAQPPLSFDVWVTRTRSGTSQPTPLIFRYTLDSTNYLHVTIDATTRQIDVAWSNSTIGRYASQSFASALPVVQDGTTQTSHVAVTVRWPNASYVYVDGQSAGTLVTSAGTAATTQTSGVIEVQGPTVSATTPTTGFSHLAWYDRGFRLMPQTAGLLFYVSLGGGTIQDHYECGVTGWGHPTRETSIARIARILDDTPWPAYYRTIPTEAIVNQQVQYLGSSLVTEPYAPSRAYALSKIRDLERLEQGMVYIDFGNYLIVRERGWRWVTAPTVAPGLALGAPNAPIYGLTPDYGLDQFRNEATVSFAGGSRTARDTSSQRRLGVLDESLSVPDTENAYLALQLGNYRLRRTNAEFTTTGTAMRIRSISIDMRALTATQRSYILSAPLGAWATVGHEPARGQVVGLSGSVQGIEHKVTRTGSWTCTMYLAAEVADAATVAPYLTMGHATRGKIGTADGNKVPY